MTELDLVHQGLQSLELLLRLLRALLGPQPHHVYELDVLHSSELLQATLAKLQDLGLEQLARLVFFLARLEQAGCRLRSYVAQTGL